MRFFGFPKTLMQFFGSKHSYGSRFRPFLCGFSVLLDFRKVFTEISSGFSVPGTPLTLPMLGDFAYT